MTLTKQEAIENHRKMWNWIADELEKWKPIVGEADVISIKKNYFLYNDISPANIPRCRCYCCEYAKAKDSRCLDTCPIDWGTSKKHHGINHCMCSTSVYTQFINSCNYIKAAKLARQIANLPERKDV